MQMPTFTPQAPPHRKRKAWPFVLGGALILVFLILAMALALSLCSSPGPTNNNNTWGNITPVDHSAILAERYDPNDTWAIYWYLCGSDLETDAALASKDLKEMMEVSLPSNVQVIIEAGGANEFPEPGGNPVREFLYPNGSLYPYYLYAANGLWVVVFFGLTIAMLMPCFAGFGKDKLKNNFDLFLRLTVFFGIVVILFTEGRSRYLLSFLPVFCIVSVSGYSYLVKLIYSAVKNEGIGHQ